MRGEKERDSFIERSSELVLATYFVVVCLLQTQSYLHTIWPPYRVWLRGNIATQMQYLLSPPSRPSELFFHCQSWFFDLFFICFKLNLQLLERECIIKYAYFFASAALWDNIKGERNEIIFGEAVCMCIQLWCQEMATCFGQTISYFDRDFQFAPITATTWAAHLLPRSVVQF